MTLTEEMDIIESVCCNCKHYEDETEDFCMKCKKADRKMRALTHRELCELGARFIFNERYPSDYGWRILIETGNRKENPDVFAFTRYHSILIECKASRSDFLADKKKPFRQNPLMGVGKRRYYLVNEGVATQEEMPQGWQLLIAYDKNTILLPTDYQAPTDVADEGHDFDIRNATAETELMWSWEYRNKHKCLTDFPVERPNLVSAMNWMQKDWKLA